MAVFTQAEINAAVDAVNYLNPIMDTVEKRLGMVLNPLMREISRIYSKNSLALQSNIMGKRILINLEDENSILRILGVDRDILKRTIQKSKYFKKLGGNALIDQLVFAFPLLLLVGRLKALKKEDYGKAIFKFLYLKPYASRISYLFKYDVNDDKMLYTVEYEMSNKYDIKKLGSVDMVIEKTAESAYINYIDALENNPNDYDLNNIYRSGIATRINDKIGNVFKIYMSNDNKYLPFETTSMNLTDADGTKEVDRVVASYSEVIYKYSRSATQIMISKPISEPLLKAATSLGFKSGSRVSDKHIDMVRQTIVEANDKLYQEYADFFSAILSVYLYDSDSAKKGNSSINRIKSPAFLDSAIGYSKNTNTNNKNILVIRDFMNKIMEEYSQAYLTLADTQRLKLKTSVYIYFLLILQKS